MPSGRTGRHVMYVVWQTSSTPDTYYSCSDLILKAAGDGAAVPPKTTGTKTSAGAEPRSSRSPEPGAVATPPEEDGAATGLGAPAAGESWLSRTVAEKSRPAPSRRAGRSPAPP